MGLYAHGAGVIELPLIDFAPDLAFDASNSQRGVVLIDMDNAMPTMKGYQALNSLQPYHGVGAAPETVLGSTVAFFSDSSVKVYFGGPTHIWRLDGTTWTPVSAAFTASGRWRFTQFGDDVIAVNPIYTPGNALVAPGPASTFTPLGGSPPLNASVVESVNGQVMMFVKANWFCSGLATDSIWAPDIQTQAGTGVLYDYPGPVVASAPLFRTVIAFKETATFLGQYVGGYPVWSWQIISDLTGTWCQESVIELPDSVAFVGKDDFYTCSGYTPQRIVNSLKEWFFDLADPGLFNIMLSRYDHIHGVCYWYFVSHSPPVAGVPDRWIAWNTRTGRWATGQSEFGGAFNVPTPNQQPGTLTGLIFTADQVLRTWNGAPRVMRLETSYFGLVNNLTQCMRVRPVYYVHPDSATVLPYHVRNLGDPDISGPTTFLSQPDGWFYFRQYDRWHRFSVNTTGPNVVPSMTSSTGAEISAIALELRQGGWR